MGSGSALKDWPAESWRALAQGLHAAGHRLVFTGSGARESAQIDSVIGGLPDAINLCGKLSWQGFVSTIATARLLIGVDSAASHVAGAVQTPSLVINHGMNNVRLWHSGRPNGVVMMHPVPCAPCHRKLGCDTMACIRLLPPAAVLDRVATLLESQAPG
jgi:ADP-heptose:LPS heptosyltransferase